MPASLPLNKLINLRQLVFEVTTKCNLNCTYCGYGSLYNMRTHQDQTNMSFIIAKQLIDYLYSLWSNHKIDYDIRNTFIGFYGGEPLLNFDFIRSVISYLENLPIDRRQFTYTMTTNALLLNKYQDFLVDKKFHIIISLDGDKEAHSYRIDRFGQNSFNRVFENIKKLQIKYPNYFKKYVSFNSVLTNRSDLRRVKDFIQKEFEKDPMISEVNDFGIQDNQKEKFEEIYRSINKDLSGKSPEEVLEIVDFEKNPTNKIAYIILKNFSHNCFRSYNELLPQKECKIFPTGTCFPFDKKLFVTAKGDLLPCERINQKYSLGYVSEDGVHINFDEIAKKYTDYYKRVFRRCKECYAKPICEQCMFYIHDLDNNPSCPNFLTKQKYDELLASHLTYLFKNPKVYQRIMKEMF